LAIADRQLAGNDLPTPMRSLFLLCLFAACAGRASANPKINVLFIAVDDLKPAIGCYGDKLAKTPNLDRLAARGTRFERAYCMQAVCAPSRNAVLTGLRPEVLRIYNLGTNFRKSVPDVQTLPQWFKGHGYASHALGKIFHVGHGNHEDPASWSVPHFQAKSIEYALPGNRADGGTREEALFGNSTKPIAALPRGAPYESADVPDEAYSDGRLATEAIARLQSFQKNAEPFFLALGFVKPHLPFCAPKKYWDLYDPAVFEPSSRTTPPDGAPPFAPSSWGELRQYKDVPDKGPLSAEQTRTMLHGYYAATSFMDAQLGRVLDALDSLGLASNTVIVLWGDHGWHLGDHGMWCKHSNYEQATRAPLFIAAPGKRGGQAASGLAEFVDLYPTLCDLAALPRPTHLQGRSLVPQLDDPKAPGAAAAFQVYPRGSKFGPLLGHAVRTDRWRYVEWRKEDGTAAARELYDLQNDPGETVNVADQPAQAATIEQHAALLATRLAAPVPDGLKVLPMKPAR
jgi:iduronate 2-sulfatase